MIKTTNALGSSSNPRNQSYPKYAKNFLLIEGIINKQYAADNAKEGKAMGGIPKPHDPL